MNVESRNKILSIVLGVVILALGYVLYDSIVTPYQEVLIKKDNTQKVRMRLVAVKDALIYYQQKKGKFPPTEGGLDTLIVFLKTDSVAIARGDSMFKQHQALRYSPDSLILSPLPPFGRFQYTLNDTLRPNVYLLVDTASGDKIGDLERTTLLHAPNWN